MERSESAYFTASSRLATIVGSAAGADVGLLGGLASGTGPVLLGAAIGSATGAIAPVAMCLARIKLPLSFDANDSEDRFPLTETFIGSVAGGAIGSYALGTMCGVAGAVAGAVAPSVVHYGYRMSHFLQRALVSSIVAAPIAYGLGCLLSN